MFKEFKIFMKSDCAMIESKHGFGVRDPTDKMERRVTTGGSTSERITDTGA